MPRVVFVVLLAFLSIFSRQAAAQSLVVDEQGRQAGKQVLSLPYGFYNENFGVAAGWVYGVVGAPQPQSAMIATAMVGSKGSAMANLIGQDLQLPWGDRLFMDPIASIGFFAEADAFVDGNPDFTFERAGSHMSNEDNFITGDGWDNFFRIRFKYILPIGDGKDTIIKTFRVRDGLPVQDFHDGHNYNPFVSGRSYLQVRPFYRSLEIDGDDADITLKTNGANFSYFWDNRDFSSNPSEGHALRLGLAKDFGLFNSDDSWTSVDAEIDKYFSFGATETFRQRVLALNFWTSYSPSWTTKPDGEITNRPPSYAGATLGGLWRMRGYPSQRFNDRAAIYYAAELRMIPDWNPFNQWPALQEYIGVSWIQFVPFVEFGRVDEDWNAKNLHEDLNVNVGFGVRLRAKGLVVRVDTAASDEGASVQMMVAQPFQF